VIALVAGATAGMVCWAALRPTLAQPLFERENYRGHRLPVAAGLVIVLTTVAVAAAWLLVLAGDGRDAVAPGLWAAAAAATGFGLLGLLDDLAGSGASRGFAGHLRALAKGQLTTGIVKLIGGGVVAVVVVTVVSGDGPAGVLARAALVALAANLGNLFDRAPGRVIKLALVAFAVVAVAVRDDDALAGPAIAVGAAAALLVPDLRERCMLGDTGANVLGAAVGLAVATSVTTTTAVVVAICLALLNASSERISFSRVIDGVAPLRWADRLGAPHRPS
jgi:UDP-N-acetylmuramyl pentapeptide phosphotransferase/UDP-N-acetylglucosamine-1-phosphate transferase